MTSRIFTAGLASIVIAGVTAAADAGRRDYRDTCPPPRSHHIDHSRHHDYGNRNHRSRHDRDLSYYIGDGFSFSIGTRSSRGYSRGHSRHDYWPGHRSRHSSYSSRHYGWPSYRHTTRVPRVIVERPVVREIVREVPVYREVPRDPYAQYRIGWDALARGDLYKAREFFSDRAMYRPNDGTPKAGLALARAIAGQDDQADWAMRRAVRAGLKWARKQMPMYDLEPTLSRLEARYEERAYSYHDTWFMVAAIRYLKGDETGAALAAEKAMEYGPQDKDAYRVHALAAYAD